MKKIFTFILFLFTLSGAFSQIQDNTGNGNPYTHLSQEEKDNKLIELCDKKYKDSELKRVRTIAKFLIAAGANPDVTKDEKPILIINIYYNDGKLSEVLLEGGANPDCTMGPDKEPALYYSIRNNDYVSTRALIDAGADLSYVTKDGQSFVFFMISEKFPVEEVEYALQKGAPACGKKAPYREPVIEAIYKKNLDMIKLLEKYGASLKTTIDTYQKSALLYAAYMGDFNIVKHCIERGCKPSDISKNDPPPVYYALCREDFELAEYLIKNGDNINKPFFFYEDSYKTYVLQAMFQLKGGWSHEDDIVYKNGSIKRVLELGADPYLKDDNGENAFQLACRMLLKRKSVYRNRLELFEHGYTICPNPKYKKSLGEAICSADTEEIKQILKHYKIDKDSSSLFTLGFIKEIKNSDVNMQLLLDAGIRPDYEIIYKSLFFDSVEEYTKKLCSYIDLLKGSDEWKYDFVSYCFLKHTYGFSYDNNYIKRFVNLVLDNGISFDTLIYNNDSKYPEMIPFLFYIIINDKSDNLSGIQALLDRGADINQVWNGKRPIDYLKSGDKKHTFLMDHGAKVYN